MTTRHGQLLYLYYRLRVLTALHLIALLCGGRVAHDGRRMVGSLGSDEVFFHKSLSDANSYPANAVARHYEVDGY